MFKSIKTSKSLRKSAGPAAEFCRLPHWGLYRTRLKSGHIVRLARIRMQPRRIARRHVHATIEDCVQTGA